MKFKTILGDILKDSLEIAIDNGVRYRSAMSAMDKVDNFSEADEDSDTDDKYTKYKDSVNKRRPDIDIDEYAGRSFYAPSLNMIGLDSKRPALLAHEFGHANTMNRLDNISLNATDINDKIVPATKLPMYFLPYKSQTRAKRDLALHNVIRSTARSILAAHRLNMEHKATQFGLDDLKSQGLNRDSDKKILDSCFKSYMYGYLPTFGLNAYHAYDFYKKNKKYKKEKEKEKETA